MIGGDRRQSMPGTRNMYPRYQQRGRGVRRGGDRAGAEGGHEQEVLGRGPRARGDAQEAVRAPCLALQGCAGFGLGSERGMTTDDRWRLIHGHHHLSSNPSIVFLSACVCCDDRSVQNKAKNDREIMEKTFLNSEAGACACVVLLADHITRFHMGVCVYE